MPDATAGSGLRRRMEGAYAPGRYARLLAYPDRHTPACSLGLSGTKGRARIHSVIRGGSLLYEHRVSAGDCMRREARLTVRRPRHLSSSGRASVCGGSMPRPRRGDQSSARARPAWRSRTILPRRPDARGPGPSGPDGFSPTCGSCRKAVLTSTDMLLSCQWISSLTASG